MIRWHTSTGRSTQAHRLLFGLLAALVCVLPAKVSAEIIDDIEIKADQGVLEYRIQFTVPVQYVKHFPQARGELVKLYLQALRLDESGPVDRITYKRMPKLANVPPFTLVYSTVRSCFAVMDPICLDIQFNQPVRFNIRPGEDGRSIILVLLPDTENRDSSPKRPK